MSWATVLRVAAGIAIGIGLAALPFLQYGARTHTHHSVHHHDQPHSH
jgi:hypothetical protein